MKKCTYCGKEYPDEATLCGIDGEPLFDSAAPDVTSSQPSAVDAGEFLAAPARQSEPADLTFPNYQWRAIDAWKCLGMILIFDLLIETIVLALKWHFPAFDHFYRSPFGHLIARALLFSTWVFLALYFARTESFASICKAFNLDVKPSHYAWSGLVIALVIRASGHFMLAHGWGKGVPNYAWIEFIRTHGLERYLYLMSPVFFAPLFEELVNRGFLFKAFRNSYSFAVSTMLILGWVAYTHWSQFSHSWIAVIDLSLLTILQCYLREKSNSLWDCILCHFAYNASLLFIAGNFL